MNCYVNNCTCTFYLRNVTNQRNHLHWILMFVLIALSKVNTQLLTYSCFLWFIACDCNSTGSQPNTVCNEMDGQCVCKANVQGRTCDECKDTFHNLQDGNPAGCQRKKIRGRSFASAGQSAKITKIGIFEDGLYMLHLSKA